MSITLAELRTEARRRADMEDSEFVTDAELTSYINASIAELHDLLVQSYGSDYFLSETTFSTISGQDSYDLPTDFYKVRGVDVDLNNGDFVTLKKFNFNERNIFNNVASWSLSNIPYVRYRVMGNKIRFTPLPESNRTVKIWYIPLATKLIDDTDTLDDFNQYSEYVIVDVAIKMLQKEESDVTILLAQKQQLKLRIEAASQDRDAGESESISDVYNENFDILNTSTFRDR